MKLIGDAKAGDLLSNGSYFLGWSALDNCVGVECPSCHGHCEGTDSTVQEIASELNCGRSWACCCRAFICKLCNKRWVGKRPAPEL